MSELILIAGGTCSGKTTLARKLGEWFGDGAIVCSQGNYYKDQRDLGEDEIARYDFDHPDAIDSERMLSDVFEMLGNRPVKVPVYNHLTHSREDFTETLPAAEFVIFEGILALHYWELVEKALGKIFVHCEENVRINRRIQRDTSDRGCTEEQARVRYMSMAAPAYKELVEPTMIYADVVVSGGGDADTSLEAIEDYLLSKLGSTARIVGCGRELSKKMRYECNRGRCVN